ncbi:MAG: tetratricopeptide repeat protein [Candidatus Malihini olakiniferum]
MMENVYAYAYQTYKNGQLEEAKNLFYFLFL